MKQPTLDDALAATFAAAQDGMDRAERHADPDWKDACRRIIKSLARSGEPFTSDDVCAALDRVPESTHDRRAVGPMIAAAGRRGEIVKTGGWRRSTRRHGSMQWLWIGVAGGTSARWTGDDEGQVAS